MRELIGSACEDVLDPDFFGADVSISMDLLPKVPSAGVYMGMT